MSAARKRQLGALPPRYGFMLNPYPEHRVARCPLCESKMGQRKVPLLIHVDPMHMLALNYTCRFCAGCKLLVAHKHEVERLLYYLFQTSDPSVVGNDYLVLGTLDKSAWRRGAKQEITVAEMPRYVHDFVAYNELRVTQAGWYLKDQEPPIREPPPSQLWIKRKRR